MRVVTVRSDNYLGIEMAETNTLQKQQQQARDLQLAIRNGDVIKAQELAKTLAESKLPIVILMEDIAKSESTDMDILRLLHLSIYCSNPLTVVG